MDITTIRNDFVTAYNHTFGYNITLEDLIQADVQNGDYHTGNVSGHAILDAWYLWCMAHEKYA